MAVVLRLIGSDFLEAGYVISFDPEANAPNYPTGFVDATDDIERAKKFETFEDAVMFWRQQSEQVPYRPDGEPNRPLTKYSAEISEV